MTIKYDYRITSTNYDVRTMEVKYSAEGYPDLLVGMPLPRGEETTESVVKSYAPIEWWNTHSSPVVKVAVGTSGTIEPVAVLSTTVETVTEKPVPLTDTVA